MEYQNYSYSNKSEVDKLLNSSHEDVIQALVGMVNGIDDWKWVQGKLLRYINHENFWIAKNAIAGLGDVARIHRKLDKRRVLEELNKIENERLLDVKLSAIDDINMFVKD